MANGKLRLEAFQKSNKIKLTASHFVGLVGTVEISVADGVLRDTLAVHASGFVDSARCWWTCRRFGN